MRDDPAVVALVVRARDGDKEAWDALVERYVPLVWSICQRFRLSRADADDVSQIVWLLLVEQLPKLREPAALPGWLATTTQRECLRAIQGRERERRLERRMDTEAVVAKRAPGVDEEILLAERDAALREGLTQLPPRCRNLLTLLIEQPPVPYAQISERLGIPVGAIGPTRARCLAKLRRSPAVAALIRTDLENDGQEGGGERGGRPMVER